MEFSFKLKVHAAKETIWQYYSNIQKWYLWEDDLEDITLNGAFAVGSTGVMKMKGMPPLHYTLTTVKENEMFIDKTETPLGTVYFVHEILEENGDIYIQHAVGIDAPNDTLDKLEFLKQIFEDVPQSIAKLKEEVESEYISI